MTINKIHYLIPIFCTLIASSCSKSKTPAQAIEQVLNDCAAITEQVNQSNMSPSQAANHIAKEAQALDVRACPEEFRITFQQHITAWRQAAPYLDNSNVALIGFMEGLYGGYTGDHSQVGNTAREAQASVQRIETTYNKLTEIAARHGARIPRCGR